MLAFAEHGLIVVDFCPCSCSQSFAHVHMHMFAYAHMHMSDNDASLHPLHPPSSYCCGRRRPYPMV